MKQRIWLFLAILLIPLMSLGADQLAAAEDILTTAAKDGSFNTLVSLVVAADLDEALQGEGSFTVFAPTDEAFAKLPSDVLDSLLKKDSQAQLANVLKYHVIGRELRIPKHPPSHPIKSSKTLAGQKVRFHRNGTVVRVNDATVTFRNIRCNNGYIHVIDAVLLPPAEDKSIVGVAKEAGIFETLLAAVQAADLVDVLRSEGPFTVFAPSDQAFQNLPKDTITNLIKPANQEQLVELLKYHVVAGRITAKDAVAAGKATTLAGQDVQISIQDGRLAINNSKVTTNDVMAENGVIHVIDEVLTPPTTTNQTSKSAENPSTVTIVANGNKSVTRDNVKADCVLIKCNGGGSVRLDNLQANKVKTKVNGGGAVYLNGKVKVHEAFVSGGGDLHARDLLTEKTTVDVNGGGQANVHATQNLNAKALAGARISYVQTDAAIKKDINRWATFTPFASH